MSVESTFSTARTRDDVSRTEADQPSLSLAGSLRNAPVQAPLTRTQTLSFHPNTFVSADYEALNAPYASEKTPVWSLAAPFPRVVRSGMQQLRRSQTHHEDLPRLSQVRSRRPDRLPARRPGDTATLPGRPTSVFAPSRASIPHRAPSIPQRTAVRPRRGMSQATSQPAIAEADEQPRISRHATYDFAEQPDSSIDDNDLELTESEQVDIDAARQRLQEYADEAHYITAPPGWQDNANVDWEEFHPERYHRQSIQLQPLEFYNAWSKFRFRFRKSFAEFLGSLIFMLFGLSSSLAPQLNPSPSSSEYGNFVSTNLAWGWGAMVAIYIAGGVSGAHLNPVISIMLAIYRGFPWHLCWRYILAQFLAGFVAAIIVYAVYRDAISISPLAQRSSDVSNSVYANVFYATPNPRIPSSTAFFSQFLCSALYTLCVLAIGDDANAAPTGGMSAFIVGLLVFVICTAFPINAGIALSPARDFGPRVVAAIVEGRGAVFTQRGCYWIWGTWVASLTGSLSGAAVYDGLIFTGGESPLNYVEPGRRVKQRLMNRMKRVEQDGETTKEKDGKV